MTAIPSAPARPGLATAARSWLWGWLAIAQLVLDMFLAGPYLAITGFLVGGIAALPALLIGLPLLAVALFVAFVLSFFERARLLAFTGVAIARPAPRPADQPRWRRLLLDSRPWRAAAHLALMGLWGLVAGIVTLVLASIAIALALLPLYAWALEPGYIALGFGRTLGSGAVPWLTIAGWIGLIVVPLVARGLVGVDIALGRWLLGPTGGEQVERLSQRVETLTQTREAAVDSVEVERRRIERDLHDGPQQRLVAIAMDLGMARERLNRDPEGAQELIDKAHESAKEAITEMRQVARGIHPPVLTDRGLDAALSALAARSPVPVQLNVDVPTRPSATVEAIAYFCVSEALTNVAKHAQARWARVDVRFADGALTVRVTDDGVGGADPGKGTGLDGLRDRVRAVDGSLTVTSPPSGGTVLVATLPDPRATQAPNPYRSPQ
jgi:signal transduction histidine kinase